MSAPPRGRLDAAALARADDLVTLRTILASADEFPGLYRMRTPWWETLRNPPFLNWIALLELAQRSEVSARREDWFRANEALAGLAFGEGSRNEQRREADLKALLRERALDRARLPRAYSLAVIDVDATDEAPLEEQSYYLMGSLLRFEARRVRVGYDACRDVAAADLAVPRERALAELGVWLAEPRRRRLCFRGEVMARLEFDAEGLGRLRADPARLERRLNDFSFGAPVVAAPDALPLPLPIRWTKPLGVTDVRGLG